MIQITTASLWLQETTS